MRRRRTRRQRHDRDDQQGSALGPHGSKPYSWRKGGADHVEARGTAVFAAVLVVPVSLAVYTSRGCVVGSGVAGDGIEAADPERRHHSHDRSHEQDHGVFDHRSNGRDAEGRREFGRSSRWVPASRRRRRRSGTWIVAGAHRAAVRPLFTPPWVNTAGGTWNAKTKAAVQGTVIRKATFTATHTGFDEVSPATACPRFGHVPGSAVGSGVRLQPRRGLDHRAPIKLTLPYSPKLNTQPRCEAGTVGIAVERNPDPRRVRRGWERRRWSRDPGHLPRPSEQLCRLPLPLALPVPAVDHGPHALDAGGLGARRVRHLRRVQQQGPAAHELQPRRVSRPQERRVVARENGVRLSLRHDVRVPVHRRLLPRTPVSFVGLTISGAAFNR